MNDTSVSLALSVELSHKEISRYRKPSTSGRSWYKTLGLVVAVRLWKFQLHCRSRRILVKDANLTTHYLDKFRNQCQSDTRASLYATSLRRTIKGLKDCLPL